jgi:hypothetical protein
MKVKTEKYSLHHVIKRKSYRFHFYIFPFAFQIIPYTREDFGNIADFKFENKLSVYIPNSKKILKLLEKMEKEEIKYED